MAGKLQRITESFDLTASKVDREKGVINDVLLLGPKSRNGREYTPQALSQGAKLFEGRPVNLSHQKQLNPATGKLEPVFAVDFPKRFGWITGATATPEGVRGTLNLLRSHKETETVFEAAERNPALYCFSPVFDVVGADANPNQIVAIEKVYSVDLVTEGGTTRTLFEEAEGAAGSESEHEEEKDELEDIDHELRHLIEQVTSELVDFHHEHHDHEKASKRIGQHLRHHHKMHLKEGDGEEEEAKEHDEEELKQLKAEKGARRVCEELSIPYTQEMGELLIPLPDDEARKKLALSIKRQKLLNPGAGSLPAAEGPATNWADRLRSR